MSSSGIIAEEGGPANKANERAMPALRFSLIGGRSFSETFEALVPMLGSKKECAGGGNYDLQLSTF